MRLILIALLLLAACKDRPVVDNRPEPMRLGNCQPNAYGNASTIEGYACTQAGYEWSCVWRDPIYSDGWLKVAGRYVCTRGTKLAAEVRP